MDWEEVGINYEEEEEEEEEKPEHEQIKNKN